MTDPIRTLALAELAMLEHLGDNLSRLLELLEAGQGHSPEAADLRQARSAFAAFPITAWWTQPNVNHRC